MDKNQIIEKLRAIQLEFSQIKDHGVAFVDEAEFTALRQKVIKWLKLLPNTKDELNSFHMLTFWVPRMRPDFGGGGPRYDAQDQNQYEKDCDRTILILDSAIENLEMDLVTASEPSGTREERKGPSRYGGIKIDQAGTVVMGDENIVAVIESVTISQLLTKLEKQIEDNAIDPQEKEGLLEKLREIASHPLLVTILNQTLGQFLRG